MTRPSIACAAAALALGLTACAVPSPQGSVSGTRLVSLAPSLTEIAYAIGCGGELVGDTRFDDYPPAARALPHVADLTHVDLELLARVAPTEILAMHDEERAGSEISGSLHVPVTYLPNRELPDIYADIEGVGRACGRGAQARALSDSVRARIAALAARAQREAVRPRVFFLLGLPGFTAGKRSYINDLIELAGGINVAGSVDQPYPSLGEEAIAAMDPDVIVVARDTPFGPDVRARSPWRELRAVRNGRIAVPPDDDLIERPGPRVTQGLAWLQRAIHTVRPPHL